MCYFKIRLIRCWHTPLEMLLMPLIIACVFVRDLSYNHLSRLEDWAFSSLGLLQSLNLGENRITHLGEEVFDSLANVRTL